MRNKPSEKQFPRALNAPHDRVVIIDDQLIRSAIDASRKSPRRRVILPLHTENSDAMHRMINALQKYSYIQPHRHFSPPKDETIIVIRGSIGYVTFDDNGKITDSYTVSAGAERFGIDTKAGVYHTFFALTPDTVLFEVKPGPYNEKSDKDFASWAPAEGTKDACGYLEGLYGLIKDREGEVQDV